MEPATLYILFTLANGVQMPMERGFVSVDACEAYVAEVIRPRTEKATTFRHQCASVFKMQSAPEWYTEHGRQRLIHGVPLDPKHMR